MHKLKYYWLTSKHLNHDTVAVLNHMGLKFFASLVSVQCSASHDMFCVVWLQISTKTIDHVDLLREQLKILAGEVALHTSVLKRLTEEAGRNPNSEKIQVLAYVIYNLAYCYILFTTRSLTFLAF
jgi:hypothetical protein